MIMEVIKAGADGYALKEAEPDELINAVKTVLAGDIYLDSKITTLLVRDYIRKLNIPSIPEARRGDLSPRECEIVAQMCIRDSHDRAAAGLQLNDTVAQEDRPQRL